MKIKLCEHSNQFSLGIYFDIHDVHDKTVRHYHVFIEIGFYCIEITFRKDK